MDANDVLKLEEQITFRSDIEDDDILGFFGDDSEDKEDPENNDDPKEDDPSTTEGETVEGKEDKTVEDNPSVDLEDDDDDDEDDLDDDDDNSGETTKSALESQYNFLLNQNLLDVDEGFEFDGTIEKFEEAVKQTKKKQLEKGVDMILDSIDPNMATILEYAIQGGKDIDEVFNYLKGVTPDVEYDLEKEEDQEAVMREYYKKTTRFSDAKISKLIKIAKDNDELEEEAEDALGKLDKIKEKEEEEFVKKAELQKQQELQRIQKLHDDFVSTTQKMNYNDQRSKEIIASIFDTVNYGKKIGKMSKFNRVNQMIRSNIEHTTQLADIFLHYDPKTGFKKFFESVQKDAKSKTTKTIRDNIQDMINGSGGKVAKGKTKRRRRTKDNVLDMFYDQTRED